MSEVFLAHCEMDDAHTKKARAALRRALRENQNALTDDLEADCIVEQVWNSLTGLDKVKPAKRR